MKEISITFPKYPEEVKVSDKRRKKYYKKGEKLPDKYKSIQYGWSSSGFLIDIQTGQRVVKNPRSAGTPSYVSLSANSLWSKMHERVQMEVVSTVKNYMEKHLPNKIKLNPPYKISCTVYCTPKLGNWDIGNFWIYNKLFEDLLVNKQLIRDDSIMYITQSGGFRFIPIDDYENRKLVFKIEEDYHPAIRNHVMYNLDPKKPMRVAYKPERTIDIHIIPPEEDNIYRVGSPGDIFINGVDIYINSGKIKLIPAAITNGLGRVYSQCIQLNKNAAMSVEQYKKYKEYVDKELIEKGIPFLLYD